MTRRLFGPQDERVIATFSKEDGMSVIDLDPNTDQYPEHDHSADGQEEVYIALRGGGVIEIEGQTFPLDGDHVVRVGAGTTRKIRPGPEGLRLLALGGIPGQPYEPPQPRG